MKLKRSCEFFLYLKPFYKKKKLLNLVYEHACQLNKVTQDFICIRIFIGFIYKFKQTKVFTRLPNRILSTSSCVSGKACVIICEISLFVTAVNPEAILLATVCVARSEALAGE